MINNQVKSGFYIDRHVINYKIVDVACEFVKSERLIMLMTT